MWTREMITPVTRNHQDALQITENWLFCKRSGIGVAAARYLLGPFPEAASSGISLGLEHDLGRIPAGAVVQNVKALAMLPLNTFAQWQDFRSFARKQPDGCCLCWMTHLELATGRESGKSVVSRNAARPN